MGATQRQTRRGETREADPPARRSPTGLAPPAHLSHLTELARADPTRRPALEGSGSVLSKRSRTLYLEAGGRGREASWNTSPILLPFPFWFFFQNQTSRTSQAKSWKGLWAGGRRQPHHPCSTPHAAPFTARLRILITCNWGSPWSLFCK